VEEPAGESPKLTRDLAMRDPQIRPRVVVFDECHKPLMDKEYGKRPPRGPLPCPPPYLPKAKAPGHGE
jgi:hypothetical protein